MADSERYVLSKDMMTVDMTKTAEKEFVADAAALKILYDAISRLIESQVTGVKGNNESDYRKGNVNLSLANLGYSVKNNLSTTSSGSLLDARQGKVLDEKKIDIENIINNLISEDTDKPLSAKKGKELNDEIQPIKSRVSQFDFLSIVNGKLCVTYKKEV